MKIGPMKGGALTIATFVALAAHVPLAFALLTAPDEPAVVVAPHGETSHATIDLEAWQLAPPVRVPSRLLLASRGGGSGHAGPRTQASRRPPAIVRLPDRPPEANPAARTVALSEGIAARTDADLNPGGTIGGRSGGGSGRGSGTGSGVGKGTGAGRAFEVSEVDVPPRRVSGPEPSYPRLDALAGREGYVTLRFVVHEDGSTSDVTMQDHQGPTSFVEAAHDAVAGWRFTAALRGGQAVACICVQKLTFQLGGRRR